MENIQLNENSEVISCDGIVLENPMNVGDFLKVMQKTRQAVEIYFDMVMKAEKGLNDFLKGDSGVATIAKQFNEKLKNEFAEKNGVTIHSFTPTTDVEETSPEENTSSDDIEAELSMKAQDLHIKYAAPNEWEDRVKDDILTQQLVVICERFVRENSLGLREPDSRYRIRVGTDEMWNNIVRVFDEAGQREALDDRLKPELQDILIASGWRVVARFRVGGLALLPFGVGVPGCFWAKTSKDDHPFWAE